jgi:hypothetical protein
VLLSLGALLAPVVVAAANRSHRCTPRLKCTCGTRRTATESATTSYPIDVRIRTDRERRAGLVLALVRSADGRWMVSVLAGRVLVREMREGSIGFGWWRSQPAKGAVNRGSSDAEQLGEFGLGAGAERVPMIGRRQDVKKRRTAAGASSVSCAN